MRTHERSRATTSLIAAAFLLAAAMTGRPAHAHSGEYLIVWAGDRNASDTHSHELDVAGGDFAHIADRLGADAAAGPDFLAVIDADPGSPTYGKVLNTIPVPGLENEPHHMQYRWSPGQRIFAGGLFSDRTFVFDVSEAPNVRLVRTVEPLETPCGSVPDAYWVLSDGSALGTYMGGPNVAGDPACNGGDSNGFAGTPGEVVRISPEGVVLGEFPAAGDPSDPPAADRRPNRCLAVGMRAQTCANPHGIQVREDLRAVITSDYAEPRNVPIDPLTTPDNRVFRDTVRVWDLSDDLDEVTLRSVSVMPRGAVDIIPPEVVDPRGVMGIMETTVTNLPGHRGAFASSMCGGQIFYTPDFTAAEPRWTQVWDATSSARALDPEAERLQGCVGAGWLQTSPDDSVLFQATIGRAPGTLGVDDPGVPKMLYAVDIRDLVAVTPADWTAARCSIDTPAEVLGGGAESSCPSFAGGLVLDDLTSGGPHWGAFDPFRLSHDPGRLTSVTRTASSNYFVARSGLDGNHKVCVQTIAADGSIALDTSFKDENTHEPCVDFDRAYWPHGRFGDAKPHSMLFVRTAS